MTHRATLLALLALIASSASLPAATTIGTLDTAGTNLSSGHNFFGETFTVPTGETGINSISLFAHNDTGQSQPGVIKLYSYNTASDTFIGSPLYSTSITVPAGDDQTFSAIPNLPVSEGASMALVLDWQTPGDGSASNLGSYYFGSDNYAGGHLLFAGAANAPVSYPAYDLAFNVGFGAIPEPATSALLLLVFACTTSRRPSRT